MELIEPTYIELVLSCLEICPDMKEGECRPGRLW